jgi:hypothetical protein
VWPVATVVPGQKIKLHFGMILAIELDHDLPY